MNSRVLLQSLHAIDRGKRGNKKSIK